MELIASFWGSKRPTGSTGVEVDPEQLRLASRDIACDARTNSRVRNQPKTASDSAVRCEIISLSLSLSLSLCIRPGSPQSAAARTREPMEIHGATVVMSEPRLPRCTGERQGSRMQSAWYDSTKPAHLIVGQAAIFLAIKELSSASNIEQQNARFLGADT